METLKIIFAAASIPSAVMGLIFWLLQKKIERMEETRNEKERQQEALQIIILDSLNGCIRLSRAVSVAVARIPDARCNGDIRSALADIVETVRRQQEMIMKAGIHDILHE